MVKSQEFRQWARARRFSAASVLITASLVLGSCSLWKGGLDVPSSPRVVKYGEPVPKGGGFYKIGKPYQVAGKWYYPKEDPNYANVGIASWYGLDFHGRQTANGEIYDMDSLSAAHPTLPLPTYAKVTNLANGREVVVRINDRGPFAEGREIDVSKRAAELLDFKDKGVTRVKVAYLGRAPLDGDDGWSTNVQFAQQKTARLESRPAPLASAAPPSAATSYASGPGAVYIQAGSFRDVNNANRLKYTLASIGPVEVMPVEVGGVTYYRVRVGPIQGDENTTSAMSRVRAAGADGARMLVLQ